MILLESSTSVNVSVVNSHDSHSASRHSRGAAGGRPGAARVAVAYTRSKAHPAHLSRQVDDRLAADLVRKYH